MPIASNSVACPLCTFHPCPPFLDKDGFRLFECEKCNHLFVFPTPPSKTLKALYSTAADSSQTPPVEAPRGPEQRFVRALDLIEGRSKRGRILDVGCSTGDFLLCARDRGWDCLGLEFSRSSAALARKRGLSVIEGELADLDPTEHRFEAIHMAEVVEHVRDPVAFLEHARSLLTEGGVLYATTPNTDCFWAKSTLAVQRAFGVPWSHATPPHHLHQFSTKSFGIALRNAGLAPLTTEYTGPALSYELGETHVRRDFLAVCRDRNLKAIMARAARLAAAAALYVPLFGLNKALSLKGDAQMQVLAGTTRS